MFGKDGGTGYEKIRGEKYIGEMLEMGCCVYYRIPVDAAEGGNMSERWLSGVWLGKKQSSDEHLVGLGNGKVSTTRSVRVKHGGESGVRKN